MLGKLPGEFSQRLGPGHQWTFDPRPTLNTTRSHKKKLAQLLSGSLKHHQLFNFQTGMKVRGVYVFTVIGLKFLHVGNERRGLEEMLHCMHPH